MEQVLDHPENNLSKDTIAQVWVSSADAKAVAERGYRLIHAASDYFYLVSFVSLLHRFDSSVGLRTW
jgi:hexosaminidase